MKCKCGFKFVGTGEFRNCDAFITDRGESGIVCPDCGAKYVNGRDFIPKREKNAKQTKRTKSRKV